jgi:hypothetical protein
VAARELTVVRIDAGLSLVFETVAPLLEEYFPDLQPVWTGIHHITLFALIALVTKSYLAARLIQACFYSDWMPAVGGALLCFFAWANFCRRESRRWDYNVLMFEFLVLGLLAKLGPNQGTWNRFWAQDTMRGMMGGTMLFGLFGLPMQLAWGALTLRFLTKGFSFPKCLILSTVAAVQLLALERGGVRLPDSYRAQWEKTDWPPGLRPMYETLAVQNYTLITSLIEDEPADCRSEGRDGAMMSATVWMQLETVGLIDSLDRAMVLWVASDAPTRCAGPTYDFLPARPTETLPRPVLDWMVPIKLQSLPSFPERAIGFPQPPPSPWYWLMWAWLGETLEPLVVMSLEGLSRMGTHVQLLVSEQIDQLQRIAGWGETRAVSAKLVHLSGPCVLTILLGLSAYFFACLR